MNPDKVLEIIKDCSCFIDEDDSFIIASSHCLTVLKNILLGLNDNVEFNMAFLSGKHTVCLIVNKMVGNQLFMFGIEIWEHKADLCIFKTETNDVTLVDSLECDGSWEVLETINDY